MSGETPDLRADNEAAVKLWKDREIAALLRRLADSRSSMRWALGPPVCAALNEAANRLEDPDA